MTITPICLSPCRYSPNPLVVTAFMRFFRLLGYPDPMNRVTTSVFQLPIDTRTAARISSAHLDASEVVARERKHYYETS